MGLLKRLRLSPLPTWMLLAAIFVNSMIVAAIQIVAVLLVGWFGYGITDHTTSSSSSSYSSWAC